MAYKNVERLYVLVATLLVFASILSFVVQNKENNSKEDFSIVQTKALLIYSEIINFASNAQEKERIQIIIDEDTEINQNGLVTKDPESGEKTTVDLDLFIQGSSCFGENQIVKLKEGIAICCGSCDDDIRLEFPNAIMCSPKKESWISCSNYPEGNLGRIATLCDDPDATLSIVNSTNGIFAHVEDPVARWEDYLIFSVEKQVFVGEYTITADCNGNITQLLRVRSAGGGGGGGRRSPSDPPSPPFDPPPPSVFQCSDNIDNDGDGLVDLADTGCVDASDDDESNVNPVFSFECSDMLDNDGDGLIDWPIDPGCHNATDNVEQAVIDQYNYYAYSWGIPSLNFSNIIRMFVIGENYVTRAFMEPNVDHMILHMENRTEPHAQAIMDRDSDDIRFGLIDIIGFDTDDICTSITGTPFFANCFWWNESVVESANRYTDFFTQYTSNGGMPISKVFLDFEHGMNSLNDQTIQSHVADPRWSSENLDEMFPDILSYTNNVYVGGNITHRQGRERFIQFAEQRKTDAINTGGYNILKTFYPDVEYSNYESYYIKQKYNVPEFNGNIYEFYDTGSRIVVGTHNAPSLYGGLGQITWKGKYLRLGNFSPDVQFAKTAFNGFFLSVNRIKGIKMSSDLGISPWISSKSYAGSGISTFNLPGTAYEEFLLHGALAGVDYYLYWGSPSFGMQVRDEQIINNTLAELNTLIGFQGNVALTNDDGNDNFFELNELQNWSEDYVLTGIESANRTIWRFTPNMRSFEIIDDMIVNYDLSNNELLVRSERHVFNFSNAHIHYPQNPVSNAGLWIIQPQGTQPPYIVYDIPACLGRDANADRKDDETLELCARECFDKIDNDGDGAIDAEDFSCSFERAVEDAVTRQCSDGIDNDMDGNIDYLTDVGCTLFNDRGVASQDSNEHTAPTLLLTANATSGARLLAVQFNATKGTDTYISSYLWDFDGDGTPETTTTGPQIDHVFDIPATEPVIYTVYVRGYDGAGYLATSNAVSITVSP